MSPFTLRSPPTMDEFRSLVSTAFESDGSAGLAESLRGVKLTEDTAHFKGCTPIKTPSTPSSTSSASPFRKLRALMRNSPPSSPTKATSLKRSIQTISIIPCVTSTADTDADASYIPYLSHEYTCRRQTSSQFSGDTSSRDSYDSSAHSSESSASSSSRSSSSSSAYFYTQYHSSSSSSSHGDTLLSDDDADPFAKGHVQVVRRSQQGLGYPTPPGSPSSCSSSPSSSRRTSTVKRVGSGKKARVTKKPNTFSLPPLISPAPSRPLPSLPMAPHPFSAAAISASCKPAATIPLTRVSRVHSSPRPRPFSRDWTLSPPLDSSSRPRYTSLQPQRMSSTKRNSHLKARPTYQRRGSPFPLSLRLDEPSSAQFHAQSGLPIPRSPHGKDGRVARRERRSKIEVQSGWFGDVDVQDEEDDGRSYYTARSSLSS